MQNNVVSEVVPRYFPVPRDPWDPSDPQVLAEGMLYASVEEQLQYTFNGQADPVLRLKSSPPVAHSIIPGCLYPKDFLGDSVLKHLFTLLVYGNVNPQTNKRMTEARNRMDSNQLFAHVAIENWHQLLNGKPALLNEAITAYVVAVGDNNNVFCGVVPWTSPVPRDQWDPSDPLVLAEGALCASVEQQLQYSFNDKGKLIQCFRLKSTPPVANSRIPGCLYPGDFLGDSVLKHLFTLHVYGNVNPHTNKRMTDARNRLDCNRLFAHVAIEKGWHQLLLGKPASLNEAIADYVVAVADGRYQGFGGLQAPKPLADLLEALAGAVYLDSGLSLKAVWDSFYPLLQRHVAAELKALEDAGK